LDEADERFRDNGHLEEAAQGDKFHGMKVIHVQCPVCAAGAADFERELGTKAPGPNDRTRVVIKERECAKFTPWRKGFTPKEHQEMLNTEAMLKYQEERREQDRRWEEERREADRAFQKSLKEAERASQEQQAREQRAWQEQQAARQTKDQRAWQEQHAAQESKSNRRFHIIAGIFLAAVAAIFAYFSKRDTPPEITVTPAQVNIHLDKENTTKKIE